MKALRRSLNSDKSNHSHAHSQSQSSATHVSSPSLSQLQVRPPLTSIPSFARVAPPQKVIKAIKSYKSDVPLILSYEAGDFFYVAGELEGDGRCPEGWYQALNPLTGSRGRVPRADFEEFHKGGRTHAAGGSISGIPESGASGGHARNQSYSQQSSRAQSPMPPPTYPQPQPPVAAPTSTSLSRQPSNQPQHTQNPSTSASTAASMYEGHVSPPSEASHGSGKGKPQPLYAVVQYDFAAERPDELDAKAGEPIIVIAQSNHEWFVAKPIGRLGGPGLIPVSFVEIRDPVTSRPIDNVAQILAQGQVQRIEEWKSATARYKENSIPLGSLGDFRNVGTTATAEPTGAEPTTTADPVLSNGDIISTHVMSFHYEANAYWFRINALFLPDDPQAPALSLVLYRLYEDFYNFQITLLDLFPREAGRTTRASDVSGAGRRNSGYQGTGRILPYMPGPCDRVDVDITNERRKDLDLYLYELLELRAQGAGYILRHEHVLRFFTPGSGDMTDTIGREEAKVVAKQVADAGAAAKRTAIAESLSRGSSMRQSNTLENGRGSGVSERLSGMRLSDGNPQPRSSSSMGHSQQGHGPTPSVTRIPGASATSPVQRNAMPHTASSTTSFGRAVGAAMTPTSSAGYSSVNAPSQSATAPQPAYIKIKILDRHTDDMVAIRVPPRVTYEQLLDKVRNRFFAEISVLQYRVGQGRIPGTAPSVNDDGREFGDVKDDTSLWDWLETHEKYVLYAE